MVVVWPNTCLLEWMKRLTSVHLIKDAELEELNQEEGDTDA